MFCNLRDGLIGNVVHIRLWDINHPYNKFCFFHCSIESGILNERYICVSIE